MSELPEGIVTDPFWADFVATHPDVDVVLVPDEEPAAPSGLPGRDPAAYASEERAVVAALRGRLLGDRTIAEATERWAAGPTPDSVSLETTLVARAEAGDAQLLASAARTLADDGWHVFVPPAGLARVLAGRDDDLGRRTVQLLLAPEAGRLVLRVRSGGCPVTDADRRALFA